MEPLAHPAPGEDQGRESFVGSHDDLPEASSLAQGASAVPASTPVAVTDPCRSTMRFAGAVSGGGYSDSESVPPSELGFVAGRGRMDRAPQMSPNAHTDKGSAGWPAYSESGSASGVRNTQTRWLMLPKSRRRSHGESWGTKVLFAVRMLVARRYPAILAEGPTTMSSESSSRRYRSASLRSLSNVSS